MNNNTIAIRPLKQDDATFLCSIFKDNVEYYEIFFDSESNIIEWNNRVKRCINQINVSHFIIEAKNKSVGWISYIDDETDVREIGILVINKENLHCGYGAKSLLWLIEKCKVDNIHLLLLNVNQNNTRAIQFYKRFGFEVYDEEIIPQCNEAVNLAQYKMRLSLV